MSDSMRLWKGIFILIASLLLSDGTYSQSKYIHRIGIEVWPGYIFPTHSFLKGENELHKKMRFSHSAHLKYSFQTPPESITRQIYGDVYQGIGIGYFSFGNHREIGTPLALYLFQGAQITRFTSRLSLNYEWNFGVSFGWKPFDFHTNYYNMIIGTKINAYLNAGVQLNWMLSPHMDVYAGIGLNHFSNGNTKYPNSGVNTITGRLGMTYYLKRRDNPIIKPHYVPAFERHISYDLTLFGAWRRRGVISEDGQNMYAVPSIFAVCGFNFNPMYNISHRFNAGISLDGVFDRSANISFTPNDFRQVHYPSVWRQMAVGLSGRAELVMPYFTINVGIGANLLNATDNFSGIYEMLALKISMTRKLFLHIGYCLNDFKNPKYLMLGLGYRFNAKRKH